MWGVEGVCVGGVTWQSVMAVTTPRWVGYFDQGPHKVSQVISSLTGVQSLICFNFFEGGGG